MAVEHIPIFGWPNRLLAATLDSTDANGNKTYTLNVNSSGGAGGAVAIDQTTPGNTNGVVVNSSALPAGAATAARQDTGNTALVTILTQTSHLPASLGQGTQAQSLPVVLPSDPDYRPAAANITAVDIGTSNASGQNSATITTGTPTAGSSQTWAINGQSSVGVTVSGTWTGTLTFELSFDGGTSYFPMTMRVRGVSYAQSAVTGNGNFSGDVSDATNFRVRATAAMTGTAVVKPAFSATSGPVQVVNPLRLFDNTSGAQATIKLASTAPLAADPALVVAISPNTAALGVSGAGASAATASGNPVGIGGVYLSSVTTYTTGQRADVLSGKFGQVVTSFVGSATITGSGPPTLVYDFTGTARPQGAAPYLYNGTNTDAAVSIQGSLGNGVGVQAMALAIVKTPQLTGARINNAAASGDTTLVTATASQTTRVHRLKISVAGATVVQIKDGSTVLEAFNFAGNGGSVILDFASEPWYATSANTALNLNSSNAVQVDGRVEYVKSA